MITFSALLLDKKEVSPDVFFLTFENGKQYFFNFRAGQYVVATIPTAQGSVKRLYSVASSPLEASTFNLLVKRVEGGVGSVYLSSLLPGSTVSLSGPAGLFFLQENPAHKVFLTTGTGLAPILSFLSTYKNLSCSLFWGIPTTRDVYFLDYFKQIKKNNPLFNYYLCLSKETQATLSQVQSEATFFPGRVNLAMEFYLGPMIKNQEKGLFEYYICGSRTVVDSLKTHLLSLGVERGKVFFEKY